MWMWVGPGRGSIDIVYVNIHPYPHADLDVAADPPAYVDACVDFDTEANLNEHNMHIWTCMRMRMWIYM